MPHDYEPDRAGMAALMRSRDMQAVCNRVAGDYAGRLAAATPRDSGETAASTHVEEDRLPDGTAGSKVVQGGASVQTNWGNARTPAQRHISRVLGGAS